MVTVPRYCIQCEAPTGYWLCADCLKKAQADDRREPCGACGQCERCGGTGGWRCHGDHTCGGRR